MKFEKHVYQVPYVSSSGVAVKSEGGRKWKLHNERRRVVVVLAVESSCPGGGVTGLNPVHLTLQGGGRDVQYSSKIDDFEGFVSRAKYPALHMVPATTAAAAAAPAAAAGNMTNRDSGPLSQPGADQERQSTNSSACACSC